MNQPSLHSPNPVVRLYRESPRYLHITPALEFACWGVVLLVPLLRLVNGPAVTNDQFVVQVALFTLTICGALGLRIYNWRTSQEGTGDP